MTRATAARPHLFSVQSRRPCNHICTKNGRLTSALRFSVQNRRPSNHICTKNGMGVAA